MYAKNTLTSPLSYDTQYPKALHSSLKSESLTYWTGYITTVYQRGSCG